MDTFGQRNDPPMSWAVATDYDTDSLWRIKNDKPIGKRPYST